MEARSWYEHLYREGDMGRHPEGGQLVGDQLQVELPDGDLDKVYLI